VSIWIAENERNARSADLFKAIIKEVYGADNIGIGHHLMFSVGPATDEQPSVDTLIFDHHVARKLWGNDWREVLTRLAQEPAETRDELLARFYYNRGSLTC
jgi:hypothetical protein